MKSADGGLEKHCNRPFMAATAVLELLVYPYQSTLPVPELVDYPANGNGIEREAEGGQQLSRLVGWLKVLKPSKKRQVYSL